MEEHGECFLGSKPKIFWFLVEFSWNECYDLLQIPKTDFINLTLNLEHPNPCPFQGKKMRCKDSRGSNLVLNNFFLNLNVLIPSIMGFKCTITSGEASLGTVAVPRDMNQSNHWSKKMLTKEAKKMKQRNLNKGRYCEKVTMLGFILELHQSNCMLFLTLFVCRRVIKEC